MVLRTDYILDQTFHGSRLNLAAGTARAQSPVKKFLGHQRALESFRA